MSAVDSLETAAEGESTTDGSYAWNKPAVCASYFYHHTTGGGLVNTLFAEFFAMSALDENTLTV